MYDPAMTQPMREELTAIGVEELTTAEDVDQLMEAKDQSALLYVNSVCGCAAGAARPGLRMALEQNTIKPKRVTTVFAGVDQEATERARENFVGYQPSSPSIGLFREGKLMHVVERHEIEGLAAEQLAETLKQLFNKYCGEQVDESVEIKDPNADAQISVQEVSEKLQNGNQLKLLDCRTPEEREMASIEGSELITQELADEIVKSWNKDTEIVVFCHHGNRSMQVIMSLKQYGFNNCRSMAGGIDVWSTEIDKAIPQY